MTKIFWISIAVVIGIAIYWLIDWHDKFPDGE